MKLCLVLAVAVLVSAVTPGSLDAAKPPPVHFSGVDVFGQPSRTAEVRGRPLAKTLALFRSARLAARLAAPAGSMPPLAVVAAHLLGDPGRLERARTRRVETAAGPIYLVPTVRGWVCVQGPRFETCHSGLLPQGVTWSFYSTSGGLDVIGIAADAVARVVLGYGTQHRAAELRDNVFFVHRPISLASAQHLPPLGSLTISYRDARAEVRIPIR